MTNNFCTLFDKNYLYRGIALYNSIKRNCDNFTLWILCMDEKTFDILNKLNLNNTNLLKLSDIEDEKLISLKKTRKLSEFSWTCKSYLLEYLLNRNIPYIVYLDSDLYFFNSPKIIFEKLKNNSIVITPHNFPPERIHWENTKGKYNAGMIVLKNDETGINCLNHWKKQCIKECDESKAGDQLYLNEWPKMYPNTYETVEKGINLGPWSLLNYKIINKNNAIYINDDILTLFHFHALKIFSKKYFDPAFNYNFPKDIIDLIYKPYYKELERAILLVKNIDKTFNSGFSKKPNILKKIKKTIKTLIKNQ